MEHPLRERKRQTFELGNFSPEIGKFSKYSEKITRILSVEWIPKNAGPGNTGTFQTEKAGNVTFFHTEDAPEPVQLIVEMEELPKPVRCQLNVESALRQTVR